MPTTKRGRRHARRGKELIDAQVWELILGLPGGYMDRDQYAADWWAHRDELMQDCNQLSRPAAWWKLEFQRERQPGEHDWEVLARYGLLKPEEEELLTKMKPGWAKERGR